MPRVEYGIKSNLLKNCVTPSPCHLVVYHSVPAFVDDVDTLHSSPPFHIGSSSLQFASHTCGLKDSKKTPTGKYISVVCLGSMWKRHMSLA